MGDALGHLAGCVECCDCVQEEVLFGLVGGAAAAGGIAALRHALGGNRPSLRYNNKRLSQYVPEPVPLLPVPDRSVPKVRYALLIGINYHATPYQLDGCLNDVKRIATWLASHGYHVLCLTDDAQDGRYLPTKVNIINGLHHLAQQVKGKTGKSLWLHFSGHGSQVRDDSGEGLDETICPVDFKTPQDGEPHGMITDSILRELFLQQVPEGNRIFAVFDCCHSGTVLDLPYYAVDLKKKFLVGDQFSSRNHIPCDAILLSGCADYQKSADIKDVGAAFVEMKHHSTQGAGGALTTALLHTMQYTGPQPPTLYELLASVTLALGNMGFEQIPQLSASKPYDLKERVFV